MNNDDDALLPLKVTWLDDVSKLRPIQWKRQQEARPSNYA